MFRLPDHSHLHAGLVSKKVIWKLIFFSNSGERVKNEYEVCYCGTSSSEALEKRMWFIICWVCFVASKVKSGMPLNICNLRTSSTNMKWGLMGVNICLSSNLLRLFFFFCKLHLKRVTKCRACNFNHSPKLFQDTVGIINIQKFLEILRWKLKRKDDHGSENSMSN